MVRQPCGLQKPCKHAPERSYRWERLLFENMSRPVNSPVNFLGGAKGSQNHSDKTPSPACSKAGSNCCLLLLLCNVAMPCRHITPSRVEQPRESVGLLGRTSRAVVSRHVQGDRTVRPIEQPRVFMAVSGDASRCPSQSKPLQACISRVSMPNGVMYQEWLG